jgi:hypothetical protein
MSVEIIPYIPHFYVDLPHIAKVETAWNGIDRILYDIVARFNVRQSCALEFGVQFGYSTTALANVFDVVIGVDTFRGDQHSLVREDHFLRTKESLREWPNILLLQADYRDYMTWYWMEKAAAAPSRRHKVDLIHIDIVHTYDETFECGRWALAQSPIVLFHDTESFPDVKRVCCDLAEESGRKFYNYEPCHGLGILV